MRRLLCFAQGTEGDWEAACPDLDITVQGRSYEEVYDLLNAAIRDYVEAAPQGALAGASVLCRRLPALRLGFVR